MVNIKNQNGFVLPMVLVLIFLSSLLVAIMLDMTNSDRIVVQDNADGTAAVYLAEMGMNRITEAMWIGYDSAPAASRTQWLQANYHTYDQDDVSVPETGTYSVYYVDSFPVDSSSINVAFEAVGKVGDTTRAVTRLVQYGLGRSPVFDYAYFANNFGWLWGGGIEVNGEVRANGDFSVKNAWVNGDIVGSINDEIGAPGSVSGNSNHKDLAHYRNQAEDHFRPAYPDAEYGYDGDSERFAYQEILEMPYLDDISRYETLAVEKNGTITQNGATLVNNVCPDSYLVLVGTAANPIELNGPVVVKGDVIIKGVVRGQGTIYTERNIHIVGDVEYETQPTWPKDGTDLETVAAHNANADFLGMAARGSIIYGNYTQNAWKTQVGNYIKPPFTNAYIDEDGSWFNADYTANDGGKKSDNSNRKYYESSLKDSAFNALCDNGFPRRIDGLMYTNHLLGGRTEACDINGSVIMRDEAIIFQGNIDINYDYRAREEGENYIDIDLPKSPRFIPMAWFEGSYNSNLERFNIDMSD